MIKFTKIAFALVLQCIYITASAQEAGFFSPPELYMPDTVSTAASEVKITFSPDSTLILWGAIGRDGGAGGFDIWYISKEAGRWSAAQPVSFNSDSNDFDPCFSPDGSGVYFFSNRPNGFGGDDIYFVPYFKQQNKFGDPVNMGANFNTTGDEWGPVLSPDGKKFMYCTDGLSGIGKHDIFVCALMDGCWTKPVNLEELNSEMDDFDPVFLHDGSTIVFSRMINENEVYLFISMLNGINYTTPKRIECGINEEKTWNFGSSINWNDPESFFISSHRANDSRGRIDIYRVPYKPAGLH